MTVDLHDYALSTIFLASIVFILAASEASCLVYGRLAGLAMTVFRATFLSNVTVANDFASRVPRGTNID